MRLADFILRDMERILAQWEAFAVTLLPAAARLDSLALRDHAQPLLEAIVADLSTSQTREAQSHKAWGRGPQPADAPHTAAHTHATLRAQGGFDINQLAAEYRALRASVLELWMDDCLPEGPHVGDIIRFDEAIDQAIAESIRSFSAEVERARNLFLGMLGHDMRSPLQTIQATASYLTGINAGESVSAAANRLIRTGARMQALLDDLCDFNRTELGLGISIVPADVDLAMVFTDETDQLRAAHPDRQIVLEAPLSLRGVWDGPRLQQLLGNLVVNAIRYGAHDMPVRVVMTGDGTEVRFEVRNSGAAIEPALLQRLFDPLQRGPDAAAPNGANLGLGLYIAREIAVAHGGTIDVRSDEQETVFTVRLPRQAVTRRAL
ncbi:sensor histidine kinase [Paraburkholderia hospita]|uniref:histidine kinase n=1 Tax=Paraburkholderia hospita TaxID=169430 RepID=A0ABP2PNR6_9BURK|nr:sensor histidine kinase [Paraburkholderia hospita]EIM99204.1 histidine kinase [Paraburkholderia hospita]OUL79290.1 two-component sensor histidine kinase [Paraburkholderia hospita]OUL91378.1 two-component sensor histidine kinase [Paraburkholderia hospita]